MRYPTRSVSEEESVFWMGGNQASVTEELAPTAVGAFALTVMENAGRFATADPSLALTTIFRYVPTWVGSGEPAIVPLAVSIESHLGSLRMLNTIRLSNGSGAT